MCHVTKTPKRSNALPNAISYWTDASIHALGTVMTVRKDNSMCLANENVAVAWCVVIIALSLVPKTARLALGNAITDVPIANVRIVVEIFVLHARRSVLGDVSIMNAQHYVVNHVTARAAMSDVRRRFQNVDINALDYVVRNAPRFVPFVIQTMTSFKHSLAVKTSIHATLHLNVVTVLQWMIWTTGCTHRKNPTLFNFLNVHAVRPLSDIAHDTVHRSITSSVLSTV